MRLYFIFDNRRCSINDLYNFIPNTFFAKLVIKFNLPPIITCSGIMRM